MHCLTHFIMSKSLWVPTQVWFILLRNDKTVPHTNFISYLIVKYFIILHIMVYCTSYIKHRRLSKMYNIIYYLVLGGSILLIGILFFETCEFNNFNFLFLEVVSYIFMIVGLVYLYKSFNMIQDLMSVSALL